MWKKPDDQEILESDFDDQPMLPLDERFRNAEQFCLDFDSDESPERQLLLRRIFNR